MRLYTQKLASIFLRESNAIEGIYDDESLEQAEIAWRYLIRQKVLTTSVVLKTHKLLMNNQPLEPNYKGCFRDCPVYIAGKEALGYELVGPYMQNWCFETMRASPPVDAKALHIAYEAIHPFVDGNGRTGRMFMNWTRIRRLKQPILIIKESERQSYYEWFK